MRPLSKFSKTFSVASLALALSLLPISPPAAWGQVAAQGSAPALNDGVNGFRETGEFELLVGGELVEGAKIYRSQSPALFLVVSAKLGSPVVLTPRTGQVQTISTMSMGERPGGWVDILPRAVVGEHGRFSVEQLNVKFIVDGVQATLRPKPALVGMQTTDDLRSHKPEYGHLADDYKPSEPMLEQLRKSGKQVRVRVFFGTWCPACGQMVPRIMKVAGALEGSNVSVEYYGLPRGFGDDPQASEYGITSVPTGVVFVDGVELEERIAGNSWRVPELALNRLLADS